MRTVVARAACYIECVKTECSGKHTVETVAVGKLELGFLKKSRRIFRRCEIRSFFQKRNAVKIIYGNEFLLLNPLYAQCPIYGSLGSIGNFNDIRMISSMSISTRPITPIQSDHRIVVSDLL